MWNIKFRAPPKGVSASDSLCPHPHPPTPSGGQTTHNFAVLAPEIEPEETGAVVRGHFQFVEGSSPERRGRRSGAHAVSGAASRSRGVKREALFMVDNQLTGLALPRATCNRGIIQIKITTATRLNERRPSWIHATPTRVIAASIILPLFPEHVSRHIIGNFVAHHLRDTVK